MKNHKSLMYIFYNGRNRRQNHESIIKLNYTKQMHMYTYPLCELPTKKKKLMSGNFNPLPHHLLFYSMFRNIKSIM